jgi:multiple antibiotic resistance protein
MGVSMVGSILTLAFSFFLLLDPLGNVPLYLAILKNVDPKRQRLIIFREMMIALGVILIFAWVGQEILSLLRISDATLALSGGILLFMIALKMVFSSSNQEFDAKEYHEEPLIVPLAIPLIAGPSILAAVMIYAKKEANVMVLFSAIFIAWLASFIILYYSDILKKILSKNGILALEKLMGLILTLIAVEMFLDGVTRFFCTLE